MAQIEVEVRMDGGRQDGLLWMALWEFQEYGSRRVPFHWTYLEIAPEWRWCPHCKGAGCTACCGTGID